MKELTTTVYRHSEDLPDMECKNFFHGKSLFMLYEQTPRMSPRMAVVSTADGRAVGHLLAVVRYRMSLFPPYIYRHCRILGEGEYEECEYTRTELFDAALQCLTKELNGTVLYIELSNLSSKMFGYRQFRQAGYFPVHWMSIHNSLHSKEPEERLNEKMKKRIAEGYRKGVVTMEVTGEDDLKDFSRLMHNHNRLKPKRYIPDIRFFRGIMEGDYGRLFITKYKGKTIGCCACTYSEGNAYLWYSAFLRKSFIMLHPDTMTIWHAIKDSHGRGYQHIFFMDVGLPFRKNPFREFILRFGGKPASTIRWFRVSLRWLNAIIARIYSD